MTIVIPGGSGQVGTILARALHGGGHRVVVLARQPQPRLQAATATIYAHRYDAPNDEASGLIGGHEPGAPDTRKFSIDVAQAWERALEEAVTRERARLRCGRRSR